MPVRGFLFMGVMIPMKRERMLTIRVTDDEHARLLERCEGKQLAVWMAGPEKITQGQCQRFVNTDVGVPQGSQQHPAMQIRNIMVQGADFRVSDFTKHGNRRPFMLLLRSQTFCSSSRFTFARVSVIHSANQATPPA
jgi:hypothetical protein